MGISINTNVGALSASAATAAINKSMETSMERLSTGKRINTAADDAAGVAIASRLTAEIRGTNQAIRNAADAQAMIDTAEGAHQEVEFLLQRARELAVQSANDTNSSNDRSNLQLEFDQLLSEINRIANASTWAGQKLLNGTGGVVSGAGASVESAFTFQIGARAVVGTDTLTVTIDNLLTTGDLLKSGNVALDTFKSSTTATALPNVTFGSFVNAAGAAATTTRNTITNIVGGEIFVTFNGATAAPTTDDVSFTMTVTPAGGGTATNIVVASGTSATATATNIANALKSANFSGYTVDESALDAGKITLTPTGNTTGGGGLATAGDARTVISHIDVALGKVNAQRATLGAVSNRLDSTIRNMTNIATNLEAGRGRIEDADFAAETTSLAKSQILQQASMAMLAQANASKQGVLSLLQR